ncbi:hypothetical protein C9374_007509 [Naegleria lovaniensis]|uniref:Uncharacterized protein n=1 Tax=Naegleria lovaniensis TaxID=51637 RepID=A0AA88GM86_NAELO|nr:uncharacterized protein C9374_007509 [Naegleria lovaniensis]KAG2379370.1 hypothetical protein C9374_007509 [Naegleria lovaniensis]
MSSPHHPSKTIDTTTTGREIQNEDLDDKVVLSQPPHVSTTPSSSSRICSRYTQLRKQLRSCSNFKENYFVMEMKVTSSIASQKGASRRNKCSSSTTKKRNKDQQEEQQQEGHELSDHNDLEKQHSQPMMKKKKQEDNMSLDTHAPAQEIQQQPCASLLASTVTTMEMNHSQINSSFTHYSLVQEGLSQQMYDPSMMLRYWQLQMLNDIIEAIKTLHKNDHVSNHHDEPNVLYNQKVVV